MNAEGAEKYFVFDNIKYDGGALEGYDTLDEAYKHISDDTEYIVKGNIVWSAHEPSCVPAQLKIGKFYKTRAGVKALYVWKRTDNDALMFISQKEGKLIVTYSNGLVERFKEGPDDIVGDWEGEWE